MKSSLYIALSRQTGLWRQMEVVANNMANMNTTAYKGEDTLFTEYLTKSPSPEKSFKDKISYTQDFGLVRNLAEGAMQATDNPLDIAINGEGYFVVETNDGEFFTRNGQFKLNNEGMLVNSDGFPVLSNNNDPFFFAPEEGQVNIARDGTVSTENGVVGTLKLVKFEDGQKLQKTFGSLYTTSDDNPPSEVEDINITQGMLEQSNVQPVLEMTKMIALQRTYNNVQKMIENEHERQKRAIDILATRPR